MKIYLSISIICCLSFIVCGVKEVRSTEMQTPHDDEGHAKLEGIGRVTPGRLGFKLGTQVQISGIRKEKGKVGTQTLVVDTINGKPLSKPIAIWIDNISGNLPKGIRCIFKGYEDGKVIGCNPRQQAEHQFYRYFVITEVLRPRSVGIKKRTPNK